MNIEEEYGKAVFQLKILQSKVQQLEQLLVNKSKERPQPTEEVTEEKNE